MQMAACEAINYWIIRGGGRQEMSCPDTQGFCAVEWLGFLPGFIDSQKEKLHLAWAMFLLWYG